MKKNRGFYPLLAVALILVAAFLVVPSSVAFADGGFQAGQKVLAARATTAFSNACNPVTPSGSDYRGHQFSARKGEELTITANAAGEFRMWCQLHRSWAIRVANAAGKVGWVYESDLGPITTSSSPTCVGKFIWGTVTNSILQAVGSDIRIEYHPLWGWAPRKPGLGD